MLPNQQPKKQTKQKPTTRKDQSKTRAQMKNQTTLTKKKT